MTTSLDDLPQSSVNSQPNVNLNITEQNVTVPNPAQDLEAKRNADLQQVMSQTTPQQNQPPAPSQVQPESNNGIDINSFVTGIQEAAASGALQLPSRDIPQSQSHLTNDTQLQPNYIPENRGDYINDTYNQEQIINNQNIKQKNTNSMDAIYDDIHVPIILAVIYFVFQLPVIKTNTLKYIPSLFNRDGNFNMLGYSINSLAFASTYYCIIKSLDYLSI
tara:strand:+ start:10945 stop:11601 length:657 start_codon:yes stop_codon:yes gene_type:complete